HSCLAPSHLTDLSPSLLPPLQGTLLASCTCSASPELSFSAPRDSWTEGASAHLPVPWHLDGLLATSWFRGREAQAAAMIVSPEGLPGPAHTGREALGAQDNPRQVPLWTYPQATKGIIYSDLNFSVILEWVVTMDPEPELIWTLNGRIYGTGEKLFIRRLSQEQLGTYVCTGQNSETLLASKPVTISLPPEPQVDVTPTAAEPFQPDPILPLSRGSAIALITAATVGGVTLLGVAGFYCIKHLRYCCPFPVLWGRSHQTQSSLCLKTDQKTGCSGARLDPND
uniref:Ig-like domain-containing protein n=1 Tax=Sciurus vulgaris TaxID=55149 RepID=A0A8D2DD92_SCIVU